MSTLMTGYQYNMTWQLPAKDLQDVTSFRAGIFNMQQNTSVLMKMQFKTAPDHFHIGSNEIDLGRPPLYTDFHRSWHFDNTSNELTYLLSSRGSGSKFTDLNYKFVKDPCPVTGCPLPNVGEGPIENRYRRWSNADDWLTGRVPVEGADVTILSTWKMILDTTPPPLGQINIYGRLEVANADINLTASNILVFGNRAKLIVGNSTSRITKDVTITLTGTPTSPVLVLSRTMVVGAKALGVFGQLSIFGEQRSVMWTRLAKSALKNTNKLFLAGSRVDWRVGEKLVVTASGYDHTESEVVTIAAVSNGDGTSPGGEITLTAPLQHSHRVHPFLAGSEAKRGYQDSNPWWKNAAMAPEVGLLSRNVRIVGGDDNQGSVSVQQFGCRILVGRIFRGRSLYIGSAQVDGVEIRSCGQSGFHSTRDPRYAFVFKGTASNAKGSFVRNSAFNNNLNTAFGAHLSNGITLQNNVFYRSRGSTVIIGGQDNQVLNNMAAVTFSVNGNSLSDNHAFDFPATFDIGGVNNRVRGNAAGGSDRLSYSYVGSPCTSSMKAQTGSSALFWDNTAHSGLIGLRVFGLVAKCTSVAGFRATHHWEFGVFSWTASSLAMSHIAVGVGRVGIMANNFGPDPVKHLTDDKWVSLENSLIVGEVPTENACVQKRPIGSVAFNGFKQSDPKVGIMMSTFSKSRGKMDGTGPWNKPTSYPAINGLVNLTKVTFARFTPNNCNMSSYVFTNNPLSPDAMHPFQLVKTGVQAIDNDRMAFFYPPNPAWIVQEDCVDMDCDGPKHSIIRDLDGHLLGTGHISSLIPRAEIRFDSSRLPIALLAGGQTHFIQRGIARGLPNNVSATTGGCEWKAAWNGYQCGHLNHQMLIIENMDADTEVRRISPLAVYGGNTGSGKYIDLMNGPMDHGWCSYYTCLKRLSTFYSVVVTGTEYELWLTGSHPTHWRFHLLNSQSDEGIKLTVWYKNIQRKDIYKNGIFIEPTNVLATKELIHDRYIPQINSNIGGANYFDVKKQFLHLIVKGSSPVDVITSPVITVSFNVVSLDDFFSPQQFVFNLATVLGVPLDTVRLVDVVAEDTPLSGRQKRQTSARMHTMTVQIGATASQNQTQTAAPPVSEQIAEGAPEADSDNVDMDANAVATGLPDNSTSASAQTPLSAGNLTDSPTVADIVAAYKSRKQQYTNQVKQYREDVNATNDVNRVAADLVQKVLTGLLNNGTLSVTNLSVSLAAPPPVPPQVDILPPNLNLSIFGDNTNLTRGIVDPIVLPLPLPEIPVVSEAIMFNIPTTLRVLREPLSQTGHLVYVRIEVLDGSGQRVRSLGIGQTWQCSAQLTSTGSARLEGGVTVDFVDGIATFSRLRVDREAQSLQLLFLTTPGSLSVLSQITFTVKGPPSATESCRVSFRLNAQYSSIVTTLQYDAFLAAVQRSLAAQLDVDLSRIAQIQIEEASFTIRFNLLESASTAPPDVPSLSAALNTLTTLEKNTSLSVTWQGSTYKMVASSLSFPTSSSGSSSSNTFIIAAAGGGGCALLLVIILVVYFKRRSK